MYYLNAEGNRVYSLKKATPEGNPTISAHPARFSPDDKFSKQRLITKKRHGILMVDQPDTRNCGV
jgi:H/ACA ribonucleoprotein complex subunit 3